MTYFAERTIKGRASAAAVLVAGTLGLLGAETKAALINPDIIWGTGNTNGGFTIASVDSLELGLRAKRRYPANDTVGNGIVQDASGAYLFDSADSTAPSNRSMWNFDWGINTNTDGNGGNLVSYAFLIEVDTDPGTGTSFTIGYDPLSAISTGFYVGNNSTPNGAKKFNSDPALSDFISVVDLSNDLESSDTFGENVTNSNVAQNSVNMGFIGGPLGSGQFTVALSAFAINDQGAESLVSQVSIDVIVDEAATVPAPSAAALMLGGFGVLVALRRRLRS